MILLIFLKSYKDDVKFLFFRRIFFCFAMAEPAAGHFFIESHLLLCYNISLAKRVFEEKQKVRFFAFMEV